jgi:hypothetical protein
VASIAAAAGAEVVLWRLFPGGGRFPFSLPEAAAGVAFCVVGVACTWRVESARVLRYVFAVYLTAVLTLYVVPSAIGENVARLRFAAIPLAVLVFSLRRWRPLGVGIVVVGLAVSWNLTPLASSFVQNRVDVSAQARTWPPAISFLRTHLTASYRVEAVDTSTHWAASYLATADIPLARGWYRQADFPQNAVLYDDELGPKAYLRWLRGLGVRYVVLTNARPDYSARGEAALVRSGRAGLRPVFRTRELTIYSVPKPVKIITGPGSPGLAWLTESRIGAVVHRGGEYRIAVRWSPYWRASHGCLRRGKDGMLRLTTRQARTVRLVFQVDARRALGELAGDQPECTLH